MPPKVSSAMKTHGTPAPKSPTPNAKPVSAAARAVTAYRHCTNSNDSVSTGSGASPNGANPATVAAPASAANASANARAVVIDGASSTRGAIALRWRRDALDLQRVQPAAVRAQHAEAQAVECRRFAALGQAAERFQHQPADRVELLVLERRAEMRVEIGDLRLRLDAEPPVRFRYHVVDALVEVVLVLDVADDLLQHVLDGHETRHAAVLVDDDRDMVAVGAELAQQHVQPLGLGDEHRRAQRVAQHEAVRPRIVIEQLLGEQDADHVVLALADHREARVLGLEDQRQEIGRLVVDRHAI